MSVFIPRQLRQAQQMMGGEIAISARNVPHLILILAEKTYSVCWFERTTRWRIFHPYPSYGRKQRRWDALSIDDLHRWYDEHCNGPTSI